MALVLVDFSGRTVASLAPGGRVVVGRAIECEVTLTDPTISRKHAELRGGHDVVAVRDLGSRNGTFLNGRRIEVGELRAGDTVTFGAVTLRIADPAPPPALPAPPGRSAAEADAAAWYAAAAANQARSEAEQAALAHAAERAAPPAGPPSVFDVPLDDVLAAAGAAADAPAEELAEEEPAEEAPVDEAPAEEAASEGAPADAAAPVEPAPTAVAEDDEAAPTTAGPADPELPIVAERGGATPAAELAARKLGLLLDVAKGLGGATDVNALLHRVVTYAIETLDADRAAIILARDDAPAALTPAVARDRWGGDLTAAEARAVPRSIVRAAMARRAALLSVNAAVDPRFGGQSVLHQRVRSAMCAPLLGSESGGGAPFGVLYVDSAAPDRTFDEADLDFLSAFGAISAAALETARLGERLRLEAVARGNFERYFAPPVAERIARSSEFARPGGERRRVTVLFGDLRGFTGFAAGASPDAVAETISEYLSAMVDCVFRHGGTLDKFIGDAVMAQWGAPEGHPDDPDRAMRAALDMLDALDALHTQWHAEGRPALAMGIGLSYGEVFAGNIGSERRLEFTVLGDAVNQASRLCDAAGPNEILLSDSLRRVLREPPPMRLRPAPYAGSESAPPAYAVVRRLG